MNPPPTQSKRCCYGCAGRSSRSRTILLLTTALVAWNFAGQPLGLYDYYKDPSQSAALDPHRSSSNNNKTAVSLINGINSGDCIDSEKCKEIHTQTEGDGAPFSLEHTDILKMEFPSRHSTTNKQQQLQKEEDAWPKWWSVAKFDRSGAIVHDMLLAHAYAFAHNRSYAGACICCERSDRLKSARKRRPIVQELLQEMGWDGALGYSCPPLPEDPGDSNQNQSDGIGRQQSLDEEEVLRQTRRRRKKYYERASEIIRDTPNQKGGYRDDNPPFRFSMQWKEFLLAQFRNPSSLGNKSDSSILRTGLTTTKDDQTLFPEENMTGMFPKTYAVDRNSTSRLDSYRPWTIAVHIRRGDVNPCRHDFRYLPNSHYAPLIQRELHLATNSTRAGVEVHIYSESKTFETHLPDFANYTLHLDTDLAEVWKGLLRADVIILSRSSFSYVPALVAFPAAPMPGRALKTRVPHPKVIYTRFWHPPLPDWEEVAHDEEEIQRLKKQRC